MTTEEKIKAAARKLFLARGYKGTTIRAIAEEAGINPAMMGYYFRSKDGLFQQIIEEGIAAIAPKITAILDGDLSLEEKIHAYVDTYTDLLLEDPNLPLFVLSELRANPRRFLRLSHFRRMYRSEIFFAQVERETQGRVDPRHLYTNLVALTVFPFIVQPVIGSVYQLTEEYFQQFISERKGFAVNAVLSMLNE